MDAAPRPASWKIILAFAIIYVVWGSTFLAIRVGVREVPPLLLAALRFLLAGVILLAWSLFQGERLPSARHWRSAAGLAVLIFVLDYGSVFWAEQRIASGITAMIMATIPVFLSLGEILMLRTRRLTGGLAFALLTGIGGVAVLMSPSLSLGGAPIDRAGAAALLLAGVSWSIASVLTPKLPLPSSKAMSSGAQMLTGGVLLTLTAALFGEFPRFHPDAVSAKAWLCLLYLTIAGSVIAFTAYVWLIHHESPARVGTYAYVNPVVAVVLGYFLADEPLGLRTVLGSAFVLLSVVLIASGKRVTPPPRRLLSKTGSPSGA